MLNRNDNEKTMVTVYCPNGDMNLLVLGPLSRKQSVLSTILEKNCKKSCGMREQLSVR